MDLLIPHEKYLEAGVHIGTRIATTDMKKFVYKYRKDKLVMLSIDQIDKRIREMAQMLAKYDFSRVVIVASRVYAIPAAKKFAELTGAKVFAGRFVPGTFTNPSKKDFFEPSVVFVCDPRIEVQALIESTELGVPTVGMVDTDNSLRYMDFFIPCNNKGKKSVPLVFYLLAREVLKAKKQISSDAEFTAKPEDFELGGTEKPEGEVDEAGEGQDVEIKAETESGAVAEKAEPETAKPAEAEAEEESDEQTDSEADSEAN
jgi:small subunit ribosomal protein S2